ncbi:hypothetical protein XFF6166_850006 [Xanthomonas citri pv. fuscans]|nr:hypothetical protein XFF6166_850006 [Xanthomonas citri pv. fuscans]SOO13176.1 hypothetical protein XFF7766_1220002 [Xanthomonas citri pv. fuscans]SOO46058.1 hypothetical protein XFF1815_950007 [Xanthomonas citri pv. fuscans]
MVQIPTIQTQLLGEMHLPRPQVSLIRPSLVVPDVLSYSSLHCNCLILLSGFTLVKRKVVYPGPREPSPSSIYASRKS